MIYEHLVRGEYVYTVTDLQGHCIAETYSRAEAEQIQAQYRTHLQTQDYNSSLYKGITPRPNHS